MLSHIIIAVETKRTNHETTLSHIKRNVRRCLFGGHEGNCTMVIRHTLGRLVSDKAIVIVRKKETD